MKKTAHQVTVIQPYDCRNCKHSKVHQGEKKELWCTRVVSIKELGKCYEPKERK